MDIIFNPGARQISPMQTARFAVPEEKADQSAEQSQDKLELSPEGQQAAAEAPGLDQGWVNMTKDELMSMVREQLGEQKLEVNWNAAVDPDGQIWCKSYFDAYVSQVTQFRDTAESAIKDYYADAYQEALHSPLGTDLPSQLNFLAAKYQCSWTEYFDADMPAGQRQWTYTQVRAMLTGTGLRLNDPYALKDIHIPTSEETTRLAKQAADNKISELVQQLTRSSGGVH